MGDCCNNYCDSCGDCLDCEGDEHFCPICQDCAWKCEHTSEQKERYFAGEPL